MFFCDFGGVCMEPVAIKGRRCDAHDGEPDPRPVRRQQPDLDALRQQVCEAARGVEDLVREWRHHDETAACVFLAALAALDATERGSGGADG